VYSGVRMLSRGYPILRARLLLLEAVTGILCSIVAG
jgi:hypothetical protein